MQPNETRIDRVIRMEFYFDTISRAVQSGMGLLLSDPLLQAMLDALTAYYENGQWQADYEADEQGELPSELKRGVLSQDGVYNLLFEIEQEKQFTEEEQ